MSTRAAERSLTAADLSNLHDIQDNVVAPILMRYGRHVFVKFTDGARARAWLRRLSDRVNARPEERGTRFTVNIGVHVRGAEGDPGLPAVAREFPRGVPRGMRGRARLVGDVGPHAPEHWEGGLGGPDIHAMALLRTDSDHGRERGEYGSFAPRWRRLAVSRSASSRTRWRSRTKAGSGRKASIRLCGSDLAASHRRRRCPFISRRRRAAAGWHVASGEAGEFLLGL